MVSQEAVAFDDCTDCADAGGYTDFVKTMVQKSTLAVHARHDAGGAAQPAAAVTHCMAGRVAGTKLHVLKAHCTAYYSPSS